MLTVYVRHNFARVWRRSVTFPSVRQSASLRSAPTPERDAATPRPRRPQNLAELWIVSTIVAGAAPLTM
jgi:hypothetical protein